MDYIVLAFLGLIGGSVAFLQGIYVQRIKGGKLPNKAAIEGLAAALFGVIGGLVALSIDIDSSHFWSIPILGGFIAARGLESFRETLTKLIEKKIFGEERENGR